MPRRQWSSLLVFVAMLPLLPSATLPAAGYQSKDRVPSADVLAVGHTSGVWRAIVSPDGRWLAANDSYGTIVWDIATGSPRRAFGGSAPSAFSHDSAMLVTVAVGNAPPGLTVWDVETGRSILFISRRTFLGPKAFAFGEGSRKLYCITTSDVKCWDVSTGAEVPVGGGEKPDGAGPGGRVTVTLNGQLIARPGLRPKFSSVLDASFSRDARRVAVVTREGTIHLLDLTDGRELRTIESPRALSMVLSPDGRFVASTGTGLPVRIWRVDDGAELAGPGLAEIQGAKLEFNTDSSLLAVSESGSSRVLLWDVAAGRAAGKMAPGSTDSNVIALAFTPDLSRMITLRRPFDLEVWNVGDGSLVRRLQGRDILAAPVAFSPDGSLLAYEGADHRVAFWNVESGDGYAVTGPGKGRLTGLAFGPDGRQVTAVGCETEPKIFDVRSGEQADSKSANEGWFWDVAYSRDGSRLAIASADGGVLVYRQGNRTLTGVLAFAETGGYRWVKSVAFTPDGKEIVAGSASGALKVAPVDGGSERTIRESSPDNWIWDVAVSPDGKTVAAAGEDGASLWNLAGGQKTVSFGADGGWVTAIAFRPVGSHIATGAWDGSVRLWEAGSAREVRTLGRHASAVWGLAFSPNGKLLATADSGGTIHVWDVETGMKLRSFVRGEAAPPGLAAGPVESKLSSAEILEIMRKQPDCRARPAVEKDGRVEKLKGEFARKDGVARIDLTAGDETLHLLFRPGQLPVRLYPENKTFEEDEDLTIIAIAVPFAVLREIATRNELIAEHTGYVDIAGHRCARIRLLHRDGTVACLLYAARDLNWLVIRYENGSTGFGDAELPNAYLLQEITTKVPASLLAIPKGYTRRASP